MQSSLIFQLCSEAASQEQFLSQLHALGSNHDQLGVDQDLNTIRLHHEGKHDSLYAHFETFDGKAHH